MTMPEWFPKNPEYVWKHFYDLTQIPRPSKNEGKVVEYLIQLAKEHNLDVCQMALAFVNQQPFVTSNLIGATSMEQLKSNIDSINLTLSQEVIDGIKTVRRRFPMSF